MVAVRITKDEITTYAPSWTPASYALAVGHNPREHDLPYGTFGGYVELKMSNKGDKLYSTLRPITSRVIDLGLVVN